MDATNDIQKIGLAIFHEKKILMARTFKSGEVFNFPGGKVDPGETDEECLERETQEELGVELDKTSLHYLTEVTAPAVGHTNRNVHIKLYAGKTIGEPVASAEVVELKFFDSTVDSKHTSPASVQLFAWLKEHGYIN